MSLLLLTAIAGLAVTLGEDYGPSADTPSTLKNPGVYYANPVLYIVTWVNRTGYTFTYLPQDGTSCLSNALSSSSDPSAIVSGGSEAEGRGRRLCNSLCILAAPCSVRHLPFPDPPARGTQAGKSGDEVGTRPRMLISTPAVSISNKNRHKYLSSCLV